MSRPVRYDLFVLARYRSVQFRNALDQQLSQTPIRTFVVLVLLVLIWGRCISC